MLNLHWPIYVYIVECQVVFYLSQFISNCERYKNYAELNYIYFIYCYKTEITERQLNCTWPTYPRSIVSAQTTVII
jgi:hypothetical protein